MVFSDGQTYHTVVYRGQPVLRAQEEVEEVEQVILVILV
jgi:hypothetical protein